MPKRAKVDQIATKAAHFRSKYSFVALDGSLRLVGPDREAELAKLVIRDIWICQLCFRAIDPAYDVWDADHIKKRSDGGGDEVANLRMVHRECHDRRHTEKQVRWSANQ